MIRNNTTNVSNLSAILNFSEKKEILTEIGVNIWIRDGENKIEFSAVVTSRQRVESCG